MIVGESLTIEVRNSPDAIAPASARAEAWLQPFQPSPQVENLVFLAFDELVTNCIKYGYDDAHDHTIVFVLSFDDHNLNIDVIDDGRPFNPLSAPEPDLSLQLDDRAIGGLGIHLLRKMADHMAYERRDGANRLRITKRIR
jgi:anti-sigma regulatory factor (Ser/Thr protein kinase)